MNYRFTRTVLVEGDTYREGRVVADGDIPDGCRDSMLYTGWLERTEAKAGKTAAQPKATRKPAAGE